MSGYNPGRRPGRRTVLADLLIILLALVIVVLTAVIFILRDRYNWLIPVVFITGALMNGVHAVHCFVPDENRKRNISGTVFSLIFCLVLIALAVISGLTIWGE